MTDFSRRDILLAGAGFGLARFELNGERPLIDGADLAFLRGLARDTIVQATKPEGVLQLGVAPITPGGDYPSLWIRDFSMAAGCGLIRSSILERHLIAIARGQNGPDERTLDRASVPPFAVPDHITYTGGPVFFPGTYSAGQDQGGEPYGVRPPYDDDFEFVHLAYLLWKQTGQSGFLGREVAGHRVWDRLKNALARPTVNGAGLVLTEAVSRAVGFGFCDGVYLTGVLLFASLLRYRALGEMAELTALMHEPDLAKTWKEQRTLIEKNLVATFAKDGWLSAATDVGRQPDVWGTIFALYLGVVRGSSATTLLQTLKRAVNDGTICYKGAVRHVPTDRDFSSVSAWEKTAGIPINRYQNGAYWHVPSGWLASVLWRVDRVAARRVVSDMIAHFREEDFRLGGERGAPWECLHPGGSYRQNRVYMASATLPLEALQGWGGAAGRT